MNKHTKNFFYNNTEEKNTVWTLIISFLGEIFRSICDLVLLAAIFVLIYFSCAKVYIDLHTPPIIETAEAHEEEFTHYVIEYYKNDTRHVGLLDKAMLELVSGTAKDNGINPNHLLAICFEEGVEYHSGYTFLCSPTSTGDSGNSVGAFHIQYELHGLTEEEARHPSTSTQWTAEKLLQHGYERNKKYAMQRHNHGGEKGILYANRVWQIAKTLKIINTVSI